MAPDIFNKIPDQIKNLPLQEFKKRFTELLVNKCYYSVQAFLNDNVL